ncbi:MAG: integrase arm-type DNA-binding domain-containing protein, partial [Microvirga sp.]
MPSGSRSWIVEYRPGGGRNVAKRRMALGSATALTADEARLRAKKLLARVALGDDPAGERNFARRAETVNDLLAFYMEEKIRRTRKPRTAQLFDRYINKHLVPAIGCRKADRLTRAEVVRLHRSVGS